MSDIGRDGLAERLRRIEDIEEIKKLKAGYIAACDGGWNGRPAHDVAKMLSVFTADAVWDGGVYGKREGRAALRDYYNQNHPAPYAFHLLTTPIIEVKGDQATGNWHLWITVTLADKSSMLVGGVFDDEYVRTVDGWRIKYSRFTIALNSAHEGSWLPGAAT